MVSRCSVEVVLELNMYTPSTNGECNKFFRLLVKNELMREKCKSIKIAGRLEEFLREAMADRCSKQRKRQSLSDVVGKRKGASRRKLFSLLG